MALLSIKDLHTLIGKPGAFTGDMLIILGGSGVARLITLASMPFITRLYGASDYGIWVIILTLGGFLMPLATFRYELAVVLAPTRRIAAALVLAIAIFTLVCCVVAALAIYLSPATVLERISGLAPDQQSMLVLVPVIIVVLAAQAVLQAWATRERRFVALSLALLTQAIVTAAAFLLLPLVIGPNSVAVVTAAILGLVSGQVMLAVTSGTGLLAAARQRLPHVAALHGLRRYKVYALYVVPYSLSANLTERVIQIVLASVYSLGTLGAFYLVRQIMSAPAMLLGNTLRQVLFAYAAQQDESKKTKERVGRILQLVVTILAPAMGFGIVWLKPVIEILLGNRWPLLPQFAWWLMFMGGSLFLIGGLDRIFDVLGRQKVGVALRVGTDLLLIGTALVSMTLGVGPIAIVAALSVVSTLTNFVSLWVVLSLLMFTWQEITTLLTRLVVGIVIWGAVHFILDMLDLGMLGLLAGSVVLAVSLTPAIFKMARIVRFAVVQSSQSTSVHEFR